MTPDNDAMRALECLIQLAYNKHVEEEKYLDSMKLNAQSRSVMSNLEDVIYKNRLSAIETIRTALQRSEDYDKMGERLNTAADVATKCAIDRTRLRDENKALKAQVDGLVKALEIIAKRPDLPNPERDADWKNCMHSSAYEAKQALQQFNEPKGK